MCTGTSSTSSASTEMVADSETRRSKRVKIAPTRSYAPEVEEESLEACDVIRNNALTAAPRPLDHSSATDETTMMLAMKIRI
jgi:hypothetical protein